MVFSSDCESPLDARRTTTSAIHQDIIDAQNNFDVHITVVTRSPSGLTGDAGIHVFASLYDHILRANDFEGRCEVVIEEDGLDEHGLVATIVCGRVCPYISADRLDATKRLLIIIPSQCDERVRRAIVAGCRSIVRLWVVSTAVDGDGLFSHNDWGFGIHDGDGLDCLSNIAAIICGGVRPQNRVVTSTSAINDGICVGDCNQLDWRGIVHGHDHVHWQFVRAVQRGVRRHECDFRRFGILHEDGHEDLCGILGVIGVRECQLQSHIACAVAWDGVDVQCTWNVACATAANTAAECAFRAVVNAVRLVD